MNAVKKLLTALVFAMFSSSAFAITNAQVFAYAAANYPSLFSGTATAGQYQHYDYRYYPATQNYLAIDSSNTIYILGPVSKNAIQPVGPVSAFEGTITAWEAKQGGTGATVNTAIPAGVSLSPTSGPAGTQVTVSGLSMQTYAAYQPNQIKFGTTPGTGYGVNFGGSGASVTAHVPDGLAAGSYTVTYVSASGAQPPITVGTFTVSSAAAAGGNAGTTGGSSSGQSACQASGGMWDPYTNYCLPAAVTGGATGSATKVNNVCVAEATYYGVSVAKVCYINLTPAFTCSDFGTQAAGGSKIAGATYTYTTPAACPANPTMTINVGGM